MVQLNRSLPFVWNALLCVLTAANVDRVATLTRMSTCRDCMWVAMSRKAPPCSQSYFTSWFFMQLQAYMETHCTIPTLCLFLQKTFLVPLYVFTSCKRPLVQAALIACMPGTTLGCDHLMLYTSTSLFLPELYKSHQSTLLASIYVIQP